MFEEKYRLTWLASLDPFGMAADHTGHGRSTPMKAPSTRKTGIICTLGPVTATAAMITQLRDAGMNVVRLNFSHGSHDYHAGVVEQVRRSIAESPVAGGGRPVAIALDTRGPEIRLGDLLRPEGYDVAAGDTLWLTTDPARRDGGDPFSERALFIDYAPLGRTICPGQLIFIDDGNLALRADEILREEGSYVRVKCTARNSHLLLGRKGVNLPDCSLELPAVSERDAADLRFAVEHDLDVVFASFVRTPEDVHSVRAALGAGGTHIAVIAKIESREGLRNFDAILAEADGIMVARGDLGIELPAETIFLAQKMMIAKCNVAGKSVICATQMLESMTGNPRPTRAEASDVANAVLDGADCVMLSGETARGRYPAEAVAIMHRICLQAESAIPHVPMYEELCAIIGAARAEGVCETVARAAVSASLQPFAGAIICLSTTGTTARLLAKYRPHVPIIVVTRTPRVARQLHLHRGCYPFIYEGLPSSASGSSSPVKRDDPVLWQKDVDRRFYWAMDEAKALGLLVPSSFVILVQGSKMGQGHSNTLKIIEVP